MPVNYNVNGNVAVSPAVNAVQHDWSPLYARLENDKRREEAKAAAIQAEKIARANKAAKDSEYTPEGTPDINYETSLQETKYKPYLSHVVSGYKNGLHGDPNFDAKTLYGKQDAELARSKANAAVEARKNAFSAIKQAPPYVDQNSMNLAVEDVSYPRMQNGLVDINQVDANQIAQTSANYVPYIKPYEMYGKILKDIGTSVDDKSITYDNDNPNDADSLSRTVYSNKVSANFLKPVADKYGKITYVPGVTDKAADFVMQSHPDVKADAEYKLNQFIQQQIQANPNRNPQDIEKSVNKAQWMLDYVRSNIEQFNQGEVKTESSRTQVARPGTKEDKVTVTRSPDKEYNVQVPKERGGEGILKAWSPDTYELTGKGLDKGVDVNIEKYINADENKIEKPVGSQELYPNRLVLVPWTMQKGKKVIMADDKAEVLQRIKKGEDINFEWQVEGKVKYKKENGLDDNGNPKYITTEKNISVPYEDVKEKIGSHTGFDLSNRDLKDVSDFELIATIKKNNPKATPEQRVAIFKKLRGQ